MQQPLVRPFTPPNRKAWGLLGRQYVDDGKTKIIQNLIYFCDGNLVLCYQWYEFNTA